MKKLEDLENKLKELERKQTGFVTGHAQGNQKYQERNKQFGHTGNQEKRNVFETDTMKVAPNPQKFWHAN